MFLGQRFGFFQAVAEREQNMRKGLNFEALQKTRQRESKFFLHAEKEKGMASATSNFFFWTDNSKKAIGWAGWVIL